jgi:hypothetical protein
MTAIEHLYDAIVCAYDVLSDLVDGNDARLKLMRESMEQAHQLLAARQNNEDPAL